MEGISAAGSSTAATIALGAARQLTSEQAAAVARLIATDRHVRAHEQAHLAAAGPYARGGPSYSYQRGPDGNLYAVGGEVNLDTSPVRGDPEATIQKARVIAAAANAPADPSSQDRAVAAAAAMMEQSAQQELAAAERQARYGPGTTPQPGRLFSLYG